MPWARFAKALILVYQRVLSPFFSLLSGAGSGCRFEPTCSEYAKRAFQTKSVPKALALSFKRVLRCQPFSLGGWDPVPEDQMNG